MKSYKNPSLAPLRLVSVLASAPLRSAWGSGEAGSGAPSEDLRLPTISGSLRNCQDFYKDFKSQLGGKSQGTKS